MADPNGGYGYDQSRQRKMNKHNTIY